VAEAAMPASFTKPALLIWALNAAVTRRTPPALRHCVVAATARSLSDCQSEKTCAQRHQELVTGRLDMSWRALRQEQAIGNTRSWDSAFTVPSDPEAS